MSAQLDCDQQFQFTNGIRCIYHILIMTTINGVRGFFPFDSQLFFLFSSSNRIERAILSLNLHLSFIAATNRLFYRLLFLFQCKPSFSCHSYE